MADILSSSIRINDMRPEMNSKKTSALVLSAITLSSVFIATPAYAAPQQDALSASSTVAVQREVADDQAQPLLNPAVIAACNAGFGETSVGAYEVSGLGTVHLRCGDAGQGYVHIRGQHQTDWQTLVDSFGGGVWDDFMEFTVASILAAPSVSVDQGSGKTCYSAPIIVFTAAAGGERTIYPTVVVSRNNLRVITAIPTTGTHNC